jgi:hypothetical protein
VGKKSAFFGVWASATLLPRSLPASLATTSGRRWLLDSSERWVNAASLTPSAELPAQYEDSKLQVFIFMILGTLLFPRAYLSDSTTLFARQSRE